MLTTNQTLIALACIVMFCLAGMQQCHYEHEEYMKCIEKTGDKFCGKLKTGK